MEQHEQHQINNEYGYIESGQSGQKQAHALASWLLEVMPPSSLSQPSSTSDAEGQLELTLQGNYHPRFFQQLPDFVVALLNNEPQAATHYAPLLFHLMGCHVCHESFREIYDAMDAALHPHGTRPVLGQGTRTLSGMPPLLLQHLCKAWISQAEAVLRLARHDGTNSDALARLLLQQAIRLSSHIIQHSIRREALTDLVRVATLFDESQDKGRDTTHEQATHSYTPVLASGRGTVRRTETPMRSREAASQRVSLVLQSQTLEGTITQQGQTLLLHLRDLDTSLRGSPVVVSILLGSLLEPIRWLGGNPLAIRSTTPVDATGSLTLPLGETELRLTNPEERNMLEATFLLVEVRRADS